MVRYSSPTKAAPSARRGLFDRRELKIEEVAVSDAKVERIRQNLDRVMVISVELLCDALEHLPPHQSGAVYEISLQAVIKETGRNGHAAGEYKSGVVTTRQFYKPL